MGFLAGYLDRKTYVGVNGGQWEINQGTAITLKIGEAFIDLALIPGLQSLIFSGQANGGDMAVKAQNHLG